MDFWGRTNMWKPCWPSPGCWLVWTSFPLPLPSPPIAMMSLSRSVGFWRAVKCTQWSQWWHFQSWGLHDHRLPLCMFCWMQIWQQDPSGPWIQLIISGNRAKRERRRLQLVSIPAASLLSNRGFCKIHCLWLCYLCLFFCCKRPMWELRPPLGPLTHCGQESFGNAESISHWALAAISQVLLLVTEQQWLPWVLQQEGQQIPAHLPKQPPSVCCTLAASAAACKCPMEKTLKSDKYLRRKNIHVRDNVTLLSVGVKDYSSILLGWRCSTSNPSGIKLGMSWGPCVHVWRGDVYGQS